MASSSSSTATSYGVPTVGSSPSSNSSSSFSSVSCDYEVFLSFRGADIRKTFVDHLYAALDRRGIITFKDDKRLRGGESISDQLVKAIEQSRSAIVVFSKDYASSDWCLDELEKIMDCKDKLGLAVYPVFYDVDPSDVRRQRGTFGEGFAKAAERKTDKADVWRKALRDAADLSGYDVQNTADGHESQCIKQIVKWFWDNYGNMFASFDENLIGIKPRVRNLVSLFGIRDSDDDVRMIGVWGMGGSGKTTVATVAFDEISTQFDGASFIESVREASQKFGLPHLQENILSNILMEKNLNVSRVSQGTQMLRRRLCCKKVLIVLDDVDDAEQLHALAGGHSWFGKGSRIIITTRNEQLLVAHGIDKLYNADLLTEDEAIQLFSRYAFKKCSSPTERYDELSLNVVRYAAGLPLTLKVLGSFLCGRGVAEWTSALERLKRFPEEKTLEILKISFDGLKDSEKDLFLDIACFFNGWKREEVVRILDACGFYPDIGISVLQQKCLITFSNEKFQMHDLIQEMGREIVNQLHPKEPGKRSRLWRIEDISDVLNKNMEREAIEAIVYDPLGGRHTFDSKAFMSMKKLRLLHLKTSFVGPEYLPNELQWLCWHYYPLESLPENFQAPKLVGLEMKGSWIVQLWKGKKVLDKLKFLDLSGSRKLIRTPDFSGIPNLKEVKLKGCSSLIEVHPSIEDLQRLVLLDLSYCENLVDFPSIIQMKSLEILNFSCRSKFKRFPELLVVLDVSRSGVQVPPSSIGHLKNLRDVSLAGCLKVLDLSECEILSDHQAIPIDVGHLSFLEKLDLRGNPFASLPFIISQLSSLKILDLSWCENLKALSEFPSSIAILRAVGCTSLECICSLSAGKHEWLWRVSLRGCESLTMHEKCDQLYYRLEQQDNSIITGQQPKRYKLDHSCGKHCKNLPFLQSMLQGHAVVNHTLNICYTVRSVDRAIPKWFGQELMKGSRFVLELPPNWQNEITGFAMCVVFYGRTFPGRIGLGIRLSEVGWQIPGLDAEFARADSARSSSTAGPFPADRYYDVWICYISLNMLQRSTERVMPSGWMDAATQLVLSFSLDPFNDDDDDGYNYGIESCAARVVWMDGGKNSEAGTALSSFTCSSSSLQQEEDDPNFAAETTLPCSKVLGTANDITLLFFEKEFLSDIHFW